MIFHIFRHRPRWVASKSRGEHFARVLILVAVLAATGWGFWANSQRTMETFKTAGLLRDATNTLSRSQVESLREYLAVLEVRFNIKISVEIQKDCAPPRLDPGRVELFLCPADRTVAFSVPPLLRPALGGDFIRYINIEHFPPYFAQNRWPDGLGAALDLLGRKLDAVQGRE